MLYLCKNITNEHIIYDMEYIEMQKNEARFESVRLHFCRPAFALRAKEI